MKSLIVLFVLILTLVGSSLAEDGKFVTLKAEEGGELRGFVAGPAVPKADRG
jgi:hypothetical protein